MKAIVIRRRAGEGVLEPAQVETPRPGPGQIRVRVRATALNRADVLQRRGLYPAPPDAPADICGLEYAGEVDSTGPGATRWKAGDKVMGLLGGGGYAEFAVTHEALALPVPVGLGWREAAAIPEVFITAFDALQQLELTAGERLLIHAAASGVGTAALQLACSAGAEVFGTTGTPEKVALIRRLGADHAIHYRSQDFEEIVARETGGAGVNAVLDLVGAAYWPANLRCLALRGRIVLVGLVGGSRAETDLATILRKRLRVYGTVLRSRPLEEKIELTRRFSQDVLPLLSDGRLRPVIDRVYPLERAAEAHRVMEKNENAGKIVLEVS